MGYFFTRSWQTTQLNMAETEVDLVNRDPTQLNTHVQVAFEDVIGEPDFLHSCDCVWTNAYKCYNGGSNCCYKFLSGLCGICIGLCWGCVFACITFEHVWCNTPLLRTFMTECGIIKRYISTIVETCIGPCCEACGLYFSRIKITKG